MLFILMLQDNIIKAIYLINAKANGWKIIYKNESTYYIIKEKNNSKENNFDTQIDTLKKKPINISFLNISKQ
jgi:hypothetical protein